MADALDRAIDARIDAYRPGSVPPIESVETRRRAHARRRAAATALVAAVAAAGVAFVPSALGLAGDSRDRSAVVADGADRPRPDARACAAPLAGTSVPDCPVEPAGVGDTGVPRYLPPGWVLYSEREEPVPTEDRRRIQSLQRRYGTPDGSFMVVSVSFGDVSEPTQAVFGGRTDAALRPGTDVLVLPDVNGREHSFLWLERPRVVVAVDYFGDRSAEADIRKVVAAVAR